MNEYGKSDSLIVPEKHLNKGSVNLQPAEGVEERRLGEGNPIKPNRSRTQSRVILQSELNRIRQLAKNDKEMQFTALWHHVYKVDRLREAYYSLKRKASPGVDGTSWQDYGKDLERNLRNLASCVRAGAYQAKPANRVYVEKPDGKQRPLGILVLEDKIVQRSMTEVLNAIYESDFLGFSYGFRPGRSTHNALDAVTVGMTKKKVNWVLDTDIRGFFDAIDHEWLIKFIEHRIVDRRIVRHIKKWLNAGVIEDGELTRKEEGTPQGGSISPLLANICLHYAFDLWAHQWRQRYARGEVIIVRYADDIVMGFQYRYDADQFRKHLIERLAKFNLELHPVKTRLIEFGRFANQNRRSEGKCKAETFSFLGFVHICSQTRRGRFKVLRQTIRKNMQSKLKEVMPPVMEFNLTACPDKFVDVAIGLEGTGDEGSPVKNAQAAVDAVVRLVDDIGIRADFSSYDITDELLSRLADETLSSGMQLTNPKDCEKEDVIDILLKFFKTN